MSASRELSRSVEDYLKAVYTLTEGGNPASTSDLAEALEVQPASVSGMIKKLAEARLVVHEPYRGVRLTSNGRGEALSVIRRHRIIETYLVDRLGYSWGEVHEEAERLEHAASDLLIERMANALQNPSYDPHGAPIPTRGGEIEEVDYTALSEVEAGTTVEVRAVADEDPSQLAELERLGLIPGTSLRVEVGAPGRIVVRILGDEGLTLEVESGVAGRVYVTTV